MITFDFMCVSIFFTKVAKNIWLRMPWLPSLQRNMHNKIHSVISPLFRIKNADIETGWNVRILRSVWILSLIHIFKRPSAWSFLITVYACEGVTFSNSTTSCFVIIPFWVFASFITNSGYLIPVSYTHLAVVYEIYGAENNVIVDVSFVNVRREYIFMLPLC